MFKEGEIYKVKVELSPDLMGFGRAMVMAIDSQRIYVQLKSSKGNRMNVPIGTKLWFVGSSAENRFNGLWSSEVKGIRTMAGAHTLECRLPRFEQSTQQRAQIRSELNAPSEMVGEEFKDLNARIIVKNISRFGYGFYIESDCSERFTPGKIVSMMAHIGNTELELRGRIANCRFNWLQNRTEVGAEFSDLDDDDAGIVERLLEWLGNRPRHSKAELSESGSLARWVKAGKDDLRFVKQSEVEADSSASSFEEEVEFAGFDPAVEADEGEDMDNDEIAGTKTDDGLEGN